MKEETERWCKHCGGLFFTNHSKKIFCNQLCLYKYHNKKYSGSKTKYKDRSPEWKVKQNKRRREQAQNLRTEVFALLGDKCSCCGFNDKRALQIDHIAGGGVKELRLNSNRIFYYKQVVASIKKADDKYQLLCANCNWIKRYENNEK